MTSVTLLDPRLFTWWVRWLLKFFWVTLKHKWWVAVAARRVGGVGLWRILTHDLSKFRPSEAPHYARQYYGDRGDRPAYDRAWLKHVSRNDHHWEHWVLRRNRSANHRGEFSNYVVPMPERAAREMVADWCAASRARSGRWPWEQEAWAWWASNYDRVWLHAETMTLVLTLINDRVMGDRAMGGANRGKFFTGDVA